MDHPDEPCDNCPLRADGQGVCMEPPSRQDRLKMLAASGVPVQCHKAMDPQWVAANLRNGKDWRLDHPVTVPCRAIKTD